MRLADTALLGSNLYDVYPRLSIEGYDLTSQFGFNPLTQVTWTASADQLATAGQITLYRGAATGSPGLSPFLRASGAAAYRPEAGRYFALETATVAKGATPNGYMTVLDGRIDGADGAAGQAETQLTVRDMMGCYLNRIIEPPPPPETPDGTNGFLIASAPLGTHLVNLRDAVYTPSWAQVGDGFLSNVLEQEIFARQFLGIGNPDWTVVDTWVQYGPNLAEQLNQAVLQRGWALHYRYYALNAAAFVYYDPLRTTTAADYTVEPGEVIRVLKCTINDQDVTNAWDLIWGTGALRTRTRSIDLPSIALYGRRYGSLPEDQSGQIDTLVEANRMLEGMIGDTKDPIVELDYERLYFWPVELADKHYMVANGITTDIALDLSVIGYTHTIGPKAMRSVIRCRGSAIAARRRWKRYTQRMVHVSTDLLPVGIAPEGAQYWPVDDITPRA